MMIDDDLLGLDDDSTTPSLFMSAISFDTYSIFENGNRLAADCRIGRASPVSILCLTFDELPKSWGPEENTSANSVNKE